MTIYQREIRRTLQILQYANEIGSVVKTSLYFGVSRSGKLGAVQSGLPLFAARLGKILLMHTHLAPVNEAVADRLVRTLGSLCITPALAIPDQKDNATDNTAIIKPRHTM